VEVGLFLWAWTTEGTMATFAETMLATIKTRLETCAGLKSVVIDGQTVTFEDLTAQYDYWNKRVMREQGQSSRVQRISLGGIYS
jgi:hypothetical protein